MILYELVYRKLPWPVYFNAAEIEFREPSFPELKNLSSHCYDLMKRMLETDLDKRPTISDL